MFMFVLFVQRGYRVGSPTDVQEMTYGESNVHVTDDVTRPRKVKLLTPIRLEPNISKTAGDLLS